MENRFGFWVLKSPQTRIKPSFFDVYTQKQKGHPPRTRHLSPIAVLGQDRLLHLRPGQIIVKNIIHHNRNGFIDVAAIDPFMVIGSGRGNGKIVSLVPVPFRVYTIQGKGHNGQHIGCYG